MGPRCHLRQLHLCLDGRLRAAGGRTCKDIGFDFGPMVNWLGESIINRFSHPDYNWFRGAPYHIPVEGKNAAGQTVKYATWQEVNNVGDLQVLVANWNM